MSKNITIAEGKTGKNFLNVSKLKIKTTDGDPSTWIPEDEANSYAKTSKLKAEKNGEYTPDSGVVGFSKVTVDVPTASKLETKTITANGTYNATDDSVDGYSSVTVNVESTGKLVEKTITENGTYYPKDDKAKGFSKVTVNVKASGGVLVADLGLPTAIIVAPVLVSDDIVTTTT